MDLEPLSDLLSVALHATIRETLQPYRHDLDTRQVFEVVLIALVEEYLSYARAVGMSDGDIRDMIERALCCPFEIVTEQVH